MRITSILSLPVSTVHLRIKILVICNELQSLDNAKHLNSDCLKSLITDNTFIIESKFVNSQVIDNVSNFIFVSNNYLTLKI
jgi:hypothetical protein